MTFGNKCGLASAVALMFACSANADEAKMYVSEAPGPHKNFVEHFRAAPAVRAGDFVFLSGYVAFVPPGEARTEGAYEAAIRTAFLQIADALKAAGANWKDVVEMTSFHVDMREHQEIFRKVREEFVTTKPYPAWTGIGVEKLWADPIFAEIRVTAYVGK